MRARPMARTVAACSTVPPWTDAAMTATASSGRHCSVQPSLKVPVVPPASAGRPQRMPSSNRRWSRTDLAAPAGVRRSQTMVLASAVRFSRADRAAASRSRASGTCGIPSGTAPSSWPTTTSSWITCSGSGRPPHSTARAASVHSARPARGRPRNDARLAASRAASIADAVGADRSAFRIARATFTIQRSTRWSSSVAKQWAYQPGEVTPAPYPDPAARRPDVHGTHVTATFCRRSPFSVVVSAVLVGNRSGVSAGAW